MDVSSGVVTQTKLFSFPLKIGLLGKETLISLWGVRAGRNGYTIMRGNSKLFSFPLKT